jgi:hypothetical protein
MNAVTEDSRRVRARYRPLTGVAPGLVTYSRLWDGGDHLLLVENTLGVESTRRFDYSELRAVYLRPVGGVDWWSVMLGLVVLLTGIGAWLVRGSAWGLWVLAGIGAVAAVGLLVHLGLGPRCECHFQTSVQQARIAPIARMRKARRLVEDILRGAREAQMTGKEPS